MIRTCTLCGRAKTKHIVPVENGFVCSECAGATFVSFGWGCVAGLLFALLRFTFWPPRCPDCGEVMRIGKAARHGGEHP